MKKYIRSSRYIRASFSPSMPDWLSQYLGGRKGKKYTDTIARKLGIKLDTAEFSDHDATGSSQPFYLIETDGFNDVYIPSINDNDQGTFNGRFRKYGTLGKSTLNDRIIDVVYVDMSNRDNLDFGDHYEDPRYNYDGGSSSYGRFGKHGRYAGQYQLGSGGWTSGGDSWYEGRDKSGYKIPKPEEKIRDFYERFTGKMSEKIDSLYEEIVELQQDIFSPERINDPNTGSDYGNAMYRLHDAIDSYKRLLNLVDRETGGLKDRKYGYGSYGYQSFAEAVDRVRDSIKDAKKDLSSPYYHR
jgi:hypothetical protein